MAHNVFHSTFLDWLAIETLPDQVAEATAEADGSGPWQVRPRGEKWVVVTEGEPEPAVIAASYDTALLAASLLPSTGRSPLVRLGETATAEGFPLLAGNGDLLGHSQFLNVDLGRAMHVIECLRRSPLDYARVLYAARGITLSRAGRILNEWYQAPPWQA